MYFLHPVSVIEMCFMLHFIINVVKISVIKQKFLLLFETSVINNNNLRKTDEGVFVRLTRRARIKLVFCEYVMSSRLSQPITLLKSLTSHYSRPEK